MMHNRTKQHSRAYLSRGIKEQILRKCKYKCVHCGRNLTLETMTADHFIPINQGGGDNEKNLISLCMKCNKEKDDLIYSVEKYCNHIPKATKKELKDYVDQYHQETNFISNKNAFLSDVFCLTIPYTLRNAKSRKILQSTRNITIMKASLKEMDEIHQFILRYNHAYGLDIEQENPEVQYCNDIKHAVMSRYMDGTYYICRDQKGNLDVLFYMYRCAFNSDDTGENTILITEEMYITPDHGIKVLSNPSEIIEYNEDNIKLRKYWHIADQFRRTFSSQFKGESLIIPLPIKISKMDNLACTIMNAIGTCHVSSDDSGYLIYPTSYPTPETIIKYRKISFSDEKNQDICRVLYENGIQEIHERLNRDPKNIIPILMEDNKSVGMEYISEVAQGGIKLIGALTRDICEMLSTQNLKVQFKTTRQCIFLRIEYGILPTLRLSLTDIDYGYSKARVIFSMPDEPRMEFFDERKGCHYWNLEKDDYKETITSVNTYYKMQYEQKRKDLGETGYNRYKHGLKKTNISGFREYVYGCKTGLLSFDGNYESLAHII